MGYLLCLLLLGLVSTVPVYSQLTSCALTLTPQDIIAAPGASTGTISVTASDPGCAWVPLGSNSLWIQQTSPSTAMTGNGTIAYSVSANTNPTPRSGTLT